MDREECEGDGGKACVMAKEGRHLATPKHIFPDLLGSCIIHSGASVEIRAVTLTVTATQSAVNALQAHATNKCPDTSERAHTMPMLCTRPGNCIG